MSQARTPTAGIRTAATGTTASPSGQHNNHQQYYRPFHYPSLSNASAQSHYQQHSRPPVSPLQSSEAFHQPTTSRPGPAYNDAYDLASTSPFVSPIMSRTPSVAGSDRYSTISGVTGYWPQNPDNVTPAAAYVAPFGAVQVVNEHHALSRGRRASDASDFEDDHAAPTKDEAQFSPQALALTNHFLDQLLYSILSTARSTNLYALRPAVAEVLRQRLAKEAVANADEELQELLAGGEEEEERLALSQGTSRDNSSKWDLELVWKRTRLRVMVYMRLGEMEDDDEERFVKEQELFYGRETDSRRFSSTSGLVSWSAAIFLTSVLEFIAEQSLQAAGTVAHSRSRRPSVAGPTAPSVKQLRVEDYDVEKLALDVRLGRLWRTWRKTMRTDRQRPITPNHRGMASRSSFTRDRAVSLSALRRGSTGHSRDDSIYAEEQMRAARQQYIRGMGGPEYDDQEIEYPEHVLASNIPLPMHDAKRDVDEIEVPGLAKFSEDETEDDIEAFKARRNSFTSPTTETPPTRNSRAAVKSGYFSFASMKLSLDHQRSKSVPNPMRTPKLEIPGAFPMGPEDYEVPSSEAVDNAPEPKASAVDMQAHKHDREASKVLLNDGDLSPRQPETSEEPLPPNATATQSREIAPEVAADRPDNLPTQHTKEDKDEHQPIGLLSGIAAGVTAVAATAAVATGYAVHHDDLKKKEDDGVHEPQTKEVAQPNEEATGWFDESLPRPRKRSIQEIEELDRGKSMIDLKSFIAADTPPRSRDVSPSRAVQPAETESDNVLQDRALDHAALITPAQPDALNDEGKADKLVKNIPAADRAAVVEASPPSPKTMKDNESSYSDPATIAILEAPASPSEDKVNVPAEPKARDMPMIGLQKVADKPGRLILMGDLPASEKTSSPIAVPTEQTAQPSGSPKSIREFLSSRNRSLDLGAPPPVMKDYAPQSPNEMTRARAPRPVSGVPVAAPVPAPTTPLASDKNTIRESRIWQSPVEQTNNDSSVSRSVRNSVHTQNSRSEVQDHPAINNMATPKKEAVIATASESGASTPPVTSASIRGPQDFDDFLQGGDTVKYTLTPETVRDERPRPPTGEGRFVAKQSSNTPSMARSSGQATEGASSRKNSTSAQSTKSRAGRSQSIKNITAVSSQDGEASRERRRSISKPPPRNTSTHRRSGLMAREPQVLTASTRDFADFIRSTGPDREQEVQRLSTHRSTTSLHSLRNSARSQSVGDGGMHGDRERTKSMSQTTMTAENIPPVPRMPAGSGSGSRGPPLQARSATGAGSGNKDLINFIRDGPEEEGSHRISRSVAPFRNTMDSDQFVEMGGDSASNAPSKPSTVTNSNTDPTTRSTSTIQSQPTPVHRTTPSATGSTSALLSQHSSQPSHHAVAAAEPDGRKRYRNKDPYAIPSDTEDEDEEDEADFLTALPRKNQRPKEESLADFLRNNEPPTNNSPRPIGGAAATASIAKNRSSFAQTQTQPTAPAAPAPAETTDPPPPRNRSMQAQSNSGPQAVPVSSSSPSPIPTPAPISTGPKPQARAAGARMPRGNAGARLGAFEQSNTGDLADFLRSSGPADLGAAPVAAATPKRFEPPPPVPEPVKEKKRRGFFGMFGGRREKV